MDNQYTYYTTNQDDSGRNQGQNQKPHRKKSGSRFAKTVGLGLVFGVVASLAFQTSNLIGGKVFGTDTAENIKKTTTVESAKLNTNTGSTVNSDVSVIAKNAMPSVVSITSMSVQQVQNFFGGIQEQESESAGSGIIISQNDSELLMVTNNHVVTGSDTLTVTFIDGESVKANVKGTDASRDLAVIAVSLKDIKDSTMEEIAAAQLGDSTKLQVGEQAIAIGNALGYGQSVTTGIISATERTLEGYDSNLIQTDAAINPVTVEERF